MPARCAGIHRLGQKDPPGLGAALHLQITLRDKRAETGEAFPSLNSVDFLPTETGAGDTANSFKLLSLYGCTVAQERTNQSGDAA